MSACAMSAALHPGASSFVRTRSSRERRSRRTVNFVCAWFSVAIPLATMRFHCTTSRRSESSLEGLSLSCSTWFVRICRSKADERSRRHRKGLPDQPGGIEAQRGRCASMPHPEPEPPSEHPQTVEQGPLLAPVVPRRVVATPARLRIRAVVEESPGLGFRELVRRLDVASGTVAHHVRVLVRRGLVWTTRHDG